MRYYVTFPSQTEICVDVTHSPTGAMTIDIDGKKLDADAVALSGATNLRVDGNVVDLWIEGAPPAVGVVAGGARFYAKVESERMRALSNALGAKKGAGEGVVKSPMPGRVLKLLVNEGDRVRSGTPLIVVEAMKMENELCADRDGVVGKIHVQPGATVEGGAKLVEIVAES